MNIYLHQLPIRPHRPFLPPSPEWPAGLVQSKGVDNFHISGRHTSPVCPILQTGRFPKNRHNLSKINKAKTNRIYTLREKLAIIPFCHSLYRCMFLSLFFRLILCFEHCEQLKITEIKKRAKSQQVGEETGDFT